MVIFDNISYNNYKGLRETLKSSNIEFIKISDLPQDKKIDSAICVFSITQSFFDIDAFEFLKNQNIFNHLSIILVASHTEKEIINSKIATSWIYELVRLRNLDYKLISEIENPDEFYIFEIINTHMNLKIKEQFDKVTIYTDGACSGNPGVGGWAAVMIGGGKIKEISGHEPDTTNNRMEIMAVIKALETLKKPCKVEVYSDSSYVVNAFELNWLNQWKSNKWKNSEKALVKNIDLWQKLDELTQIHEVHFNKVKGHADNEYNNRCDELAVMETKNNN